MTNRTHWIDVSRRDLLVQGAAVTGGLLLVPAWARAATQKLRVAVLDHRDQWTGQDGTRALLEAAGLEVVALDPDKAADRQGVDAIVFGSFSSESKDYAKLMKAHVQSIPRFVEAGGVVLQFTQADQHESAPPFLPEGLEAHRGDADPRRVAVLKPQHPLMRGLVDQKADPPAMRLVAHHRPGGWESIERFKGFSVLAAENAQRQRAVVLEAAHGRGRFVVTALHYDRLFDRAGELAASPEFFAQAKRFAANFRDYLALTRVGQAPAVDADQPYKQPEPVGYADGAWTLAVLPDTQVYSQSHPEHFKNQTRWLVDQAGALRIQHVLHLGDVVNRGNLAPKQWDNADAALTLLHGKVPLGIVPGNHDYDDDRGRQRQTQLNRIVPPNTLGKGKTLVELMDKDRVDNQAFVFEVDGQKWLMLGLEFGPRDRAVAWAKQVLNKYADHHAVVFTHAYMYYDDTRYDHTKHKQSWNPSGYGLEDSFNDAEMMWQKAIRDAPNVRVVVSGHVLNDGQAYLASQAKAGHTVHQILQNYQMKREGGEGFMRLYEFLPDGKTVQAKTYSPSLDRYKTDPSNQFVFKLS
ncbi:MAG: metallophosphoesterase [Phycisphaeraceae bacterium]